MADRNDMADRNAMADLTGMIWLTGMMWLTGMEILAHKTKKNDMEQYGRIVHGNLAFYKVLRFILKRLKSKAARIKLAIKIQS